MKAIKYPLYFVLCFLVLSLASCEPRALTEEDVLIDEQQVAQLISDGHLYTLNEFVNKFMTEPGNFKSDSSLYRTRSTYRDLELFSIDTLPVNGEGIYIRGRIATDDYGGNFYKALVIQQIVNNEQQTLRISVDMGSVGGMFPQGQEILIRCNGLAIGRYANQPQLCVPSYNNNIFASSANQKVGWAPGRISSEQFRLAAHHIGKPDKSKLQYETLSVDELYDKYIRFYEEVAEVRVFDGRLIKLTNVHFTGEYDDYGEVAMCNRYAASDTTDNGNPELDKNAWTFGPTTGNVGYPQSRYVVDQASTTVNKANKSVPATNAVLISTSEYARYAYYYLPAIKYVGSITGVLGYYMDNGGYDPDGGEWSITPCNLESILPESQQNADSTLRWVPLEWNAGVPQPED